MAFQLKLVIRRRQCVCEIFFGFIYKGASIGVYNCLAIIVYYQRMGDWNGVHSGILEDRRWFLKNVRIKSVGIKPDFGECILVEHDTGVRYETLSDHPTKRNSGKTVTGSVGD